MVDEGSERSVPESLPTHLSVEEFEGIVRAAETLYEVQRRARIPRERARVLVNALDLGEQLPTNTRWRWR